MITVVNAAIISALNGDSALTGMLGGAYVYRGWINQSMHIPCVTVMENNESSLGRAGYNTSGHRDNSPTVQIDIWISKDSTPPLPCTGQDLGDIADEIDHFLHKTGVTGTGLWKRVSTSEQFEPDTGLFHKALRYNFQYRITD